MSYHGEDKRHSVLRDRALVGALRAREPDVARPQGLLIILVDARADRLDEAQLARAFDQCVAPQAGYDEDVSLRNSPRQIVEVADLEMSHSGIAQGEAFAQPVGDVRKADREVGVIRKRTRHSVSSNA